MRVKITVEVDAADRYVVAAYFRPVATDKKDKVRSRATRAQVRRFVQGALRSAIKEQAGSLHGHTRATARRLREGRTGEPEALVPPPEQQGSLAW